MAEALLRSNENPTKEDIKTAIEGNLCRCTGYQPIVDSILAASEILSSNEGTIDSTKHQSDPHPGFMEDDS